MQIFCPARRPFAASTLGVVCLSAIVVLPLVAPAKTPAPQESTALAYPVDVIADGDDFIVADFKRYGLLRLGPQGLVQLIRTGDGLPRTPLYGTRSVVAAPDGNGWLVADPATFGLYRVAADTTLSTITTELDIPQGLVAFDEDSVLVSDLRSGIGAVMRVTLDGIVTVFAEVDSPKGIVADGEGGFVVVSHGARALFRLSRDGTVDTLVGGVPFDFPHDLVRLDDGSFVVTDGYATALFRVSAAGEVSVLAQGPPLVNPQGITRAADGNLVVTDPQAGAVFSVTLEGAVSTLVRVKR